MYNNPILQIKLNLQFAPRTVVLNCFFFQIADRHGIN